MLALPLPFLHHIHSPALFPGLPDKLRLHWPGREKARRDPPTGPEGNLHVSTSAASSLAGTRHEVSDSQRA